MSISVACMLCCAELVVFSLILAHVPALARDQGGDTALIYAAGRGSAECVAALLAVDGINVNVANKVA